MIRLVTADKPDVVALQEVPVWALGQLERWSGMAARWVVTVPALLFGPLARLAGGLHATRTRSLATGQANALLLGPRLEVGRERHLQLNPGVSRWGWFIRLGPQQRYVHAVEVEAEGRRLLVANLHATEDPIRAEGEAASAAAFARDAERCILCGDFNVRHHAVAGFSAAIEGIDQILVRGLELEVEPHRWPKERRRVDGLLLSDHAPVEAVIG